MWKITSFLTNSMPIHIAQNTNFGHHINDGIPTNLTMVPSLRYVLYKLMWPGDAMRHTRLCHGRRPCTTRNLPLLTPFYNMECKIIRKIGQNRTWIVAAIPCVNVTPNRHNAIAQAIVYVSNDVTIPFNSMTSQLTHNGSAPRWNLNMF